MKGTAKVRKKYPKKLQLQFLRKRQAADEKEGVSEEESSDLIYRQTLLRKSIANHAPNFSSFALIIANEYKLELLRAPSNASQNVDVREDISPANTIC